MDTSSIDWRAFIAEVGPSLFRYFSMTFDQGTADDLVQETFIRLIGKVRDGKFDPAKGHLRMYLYGIAHFVRIENRRTRQFEEYKEVASVSDLEQSYERNQELTRLRRAIAELSEEQQQVIGFYLDGEISLEEIGAILEMPAATVRSHLHRAKAALKSKLEISKGAQNE